MDRNLLLCTFLLLLVSFASAIEVKITPVDSGGGMFYALETKTYRLSVTNTNSYPLQGVEITISSPANNLSFPVLGRGADERHFTLLRIPANSSDGRDFDVRAEFGSGAAQITANYTSSDSNGSVSFPVTILGGGILIDAEQQPAPVLGREDSKLEIMLKNVSTQIVTSIHAEIFSSSGAVIEGAAFEKDSLAAQESVSQTMEFRIENGRSAGPLILRVFFDDANGTHVLEKELALQADWKGMFALVFVGAVLLLVLVYFYNKGKKEKPHSSSSHKKHDEKGGKWSHA